jgi:hypothetical protein
VFDEDEEDMQTALSGRVGTLFASLRATETVQPLTANR